MATRPLSGRLEPIDFLEVRFILKRYPLVAFFAFTYALTWLAWMPLALRGPVYGSKEAWNGSYKAEFI
jgi:hypothetical protein